MRKGGRRGGGFVVGDDGLSDGGDVLVDLAE